MKSLMLQYHIALYTLVRREVIRIFRIWSQTLLPSPITMVLYLVVFGSMIGPRIGQVQGVSYINFMVPGLVMMGVINNAFANTSSSFFSAKFAKNIEEMLIAPIPMIYLILGFASGGIIRGVTVSLIVLLICTFFTDIHYFSLPIMFLTIFLTAALFSLAGFLNGIFARKFDDIGILPTFLLTPLTYLGGVFYSVQMLDDFWEQVTHYNPIFYIVNAFRYGMLGVSDVPISISLVALASFTLALLGICWGLMVRGVGVKS